MQSAKAFLVLMLALYICLFTFDWLKSSVFPVHHHLLIVWGKTFFLVVFGSLIMWLTVTKNVFKDFIALYASIWLFYFVLKLYASANTEFLQGKIVVNKIFFSYINFTQILTPLPFIAFWIFNRAYLSKVYALNK